MLEERPPAVALGKIGDLQNVVSARFVRAEREEHRVADLVRLFEAFDAVQHLFAAFGALDRFLAVEGLQLRDHFLLMANFLLLVLPGLQADRAELLLLGGVGRIVARIHADDAFLDLDHLRYDTVEEITVVGDHDHGAGIVFEI